jgi:hypothetical protein
MAKLNVSGKAGFNAGELLNLGNLEVKTRSTGISPPVYEMDLITAIARAFGCRCAYGTTNGEGWRKVYEFIGREHRVQIASYVAEVLLRKLRRERARYIKSLYRVRKRYTKICRADEFCSGWVYAVYKKLVSAEISPEEQKALVSYEHSLGWTDSLKPIRRDSKNENDWGNGHTPGSGVELHNGVGSVAARQLIGAGT